MAIFFLEKYSNITVVCNFFRLTKTAYRTKSKKALILFSNLRCICWKNRKLSENIDHTAKITLDGTECRLNEPTPFDKK